MIVRYVFKYYEMRLKYIHPLVFKKYGKRKKILVVDLVVFVIVYIQ